MWILSPLKKSLQDEVLTLRTDVCFKVQCVHGFGLAALSVLPPGDLVNPSIDLCPYLALFPASNQIYPPAEMETFGPLCLSNLYYFSVWLYGGGFVSCAFLFQGQRQMPTRGKKSLVRTNVLSILHPFLEMLYSLISNIFLYLKVHSVGPLELFETRLVLKNL